APRRRQGPVWGGPPPPLIERDRRQGGAEPDRPVIRGECAGHQFEQRGLAGAVRPDDADPIAPHDPDREIPHEDMVAECLRDALCGGDQSARQISLGRIEPGRAGRAAVFVPLAAQRVQFGEPPLVAGAPRGGAIAQPILLHCDLAAELVLLVFLLLEYRVPPTLERRETLFEHPGNTAVEPYGTVREPFEQPSV